MSYSKKALDFMQDSFQGISDWRDRVLWIFIKPYWPRRITPNQLSFLRIGIGILLFILLFFFGKEDSFLIISLFVIGILTDLFDGSVARGLNKVTEFGAMLDPIADRFLVLPIATYALYKTHWILLLIWLSTEIINAIASSFYKKRKPYTESNIFGKTKMVLYCAFLLGVLFYWPNPAPLFIINIIWLAIATSFLSIFTKIAELTETGHIKNKFFTKKFKTK